MWWRARLATTGLHEAFNRGVLSILDVSLLNIAKLFFRILVIYGAYALVLRILAELLPDG
jgi:hypothetical protein